MVVKALELSDEERVRLKYLMRRSEDWQERNRSETILLLSEGVPSKEVARRQELTLEAVYERRYRWNEKGLASLPTPRKGGAPKKLSEEQIEQLVVWAREEALSGPALLARLEEKWSVRVHVNTIITHLKRAGFVWKRTRHSLKKTR
jgi:transposase